jgi:anti-sigma-K factor RskA
MHAAQIGDAFAVDVKVPARSTPEQKPRPLPVMTTARIAASRAMISSCAVIASPISAVQALRTSGRFSRSQQTAPSLVISSTLMWPPSAQSRQVLPGSAYCPGFQLL